LDAKARPITTRAEIIRFVVPLTVAAWLIMTTMMVHLGQSHAAIRAAVGVLSGLILWVIHCVVSRRTNGLGGCYILSTSTVLNANEQVPLPLQAALERQAILTVAMVLVGVVFSFLTRKPRERLGQPPDLGPRDSEVDPPPAR
jgi:hypothetical protein